MANHLSVIALGRKLSMLVALAGSLLLAACGGGSGAPNNLFDPGPPVPGPLNILPASATLYASTPVVFTIAGGTPPYSVFSSDSSVLPLAQQVTGNSVLAVPANVSVDTPVIITARDAAGRSSVAAANVRPAPLVNGIVVAADFSPTTCGGTGTTGTGGGTTVVCSGDTGTATVTLLGPGGTALAGRQVRFDVVQGGFAFFTAVPGAPQASSVTVVTDQAGMAIARFQANVNAPSAYALIRATDLTTANQVTSTFTIAQITDGSKTLRVVPDTVTINSGFKGVCSSGFATDYYIFGGTPPYRVVPTFPNAVQITGAPVNVNGGAFRALTTGVCVSPMQFAITDATGRTVTAVLNNVEGTNDLPTLTPAKLQLFPTTYTSTACAGKTFPFVIAGGTAPYNVSALTPGVGGAAFPTVTVNPANPTAPQIVNTSGGQFTVSGLPGGASVTTVTVIDAAQGAGQQTVTATITCS